MDPTLNSPSSLKDPKNKQSKLWCFYVSKKLMVSKIVLTCRHKNKVHIIKHLGINLGHPLNNQWSKRADGTLKISKLGGIWRMRRRFRYVMNFNDMEGTYNLLIYIEFWRTIREDLGFFRLKSRGWTKKALVSKFFSASIMHLKTCTLEKKFLSYIFWHLTIICYKPTTHWARQGQFHLLYHTRQCVKHSNGLVGPTWWIIVVDKHFNQPIKHSLGGTNLSQEGWKDPEKNSSNVINQWILGGII